MGIEHITDFQLYALTSNDRIAGELRHRLDVEFANRLLTESKTDELKLRLESITHPSPRMPLKNHVKALIMFLPFLPPVHAIIANMCYLTQGNDIAWKQYWFYMSIGYAVWLSAILLLIHFIM